MPTGQMMGGKVKRYEAAYCETRMAWCVYGPSEAKDLFTQYHSKYRSEKAAKQIATVLSKRAP